jgi:hypothetical protein
MTDEAAPDPQGTDPEQTPAVPVRLVRGHASPEELSALIAVVAVLSTESPEDQGDNDRPFARGGRHPRSHWSSPARMVRDTPRHGPGGWRASASPS